MFQAYVGAIGPLAAFELTGARSLYARNMVPKRAARPRGATSATTVVPGQKTR